MSKIFIVVLTILIICAAVAAALYHDFCGPDQRKADFCCFAAHNGCKRVPLTFDQFLTFYLLNPERWYNTSLTCYEVRRDSECLNAGYPLCLDTLDGESWQVVFDKREYKKYWKWCGDAKKQVAVAKELALRASFCESMKETIAKEALRASNDLDKALKEAATQAARILDEENT